MRWQSEKPIAQQQCPLTRFFSCRKHRLQLFVLLERERISAHDAEGRPCSQMAGHVRERESEEAGRATRHGTNW